MADQSIKCYKCQKEHNKPATIPFKVNCLRCGTIIGSEDGVKLSYDLSNYNQYWNGGKPPVTKSKDEAYGQFIMYVFGGGFLVILIAVIILGLRAIGSHTDSFPTSRAVQQIPNIVPDNVVTSTAISSTNNLSKSLSIYSGQCTYSKKDSKDSSMHLQPISTGFAKVVINRKLSKLYFYFNNKLVFHYFGYSNYTDTQQGGEGFTFESDADAHRYIAERVFILNTEMMMSGQLGYQYEITNYQEN